MTYLEQVPIRELDIANIAKEAQGYIEAVSLTKETKRRMEQAIEDLFSTDRRVAKKALHYMVEQCGNVVDTTTGDFWQDTDEALQD
jgi:hypothetical protein